MKGSEKVWKYFKNSFFDAESESDLSSIRQASEDLDMERSTIREHISNLESSKELVFFTREDSDKEIPIPRFGKYFIEDLDRDIISEIKKNLRDRRSYLKGMSFREPTVEEVAESFGRPMTPNFNELFRNAVSDTKWLSPDKKKKKNGEEKLQSYVETIFPTTLSWTKNKLNQEEFPKEIIEWEEKYRDKLQNFDIDTVAKAKSEDSEELAKVFVEASNPLAKFMEDPSFTVYVRPLDGYWENR